MSSTREHELDELVGCLREVASRPSTGADRLLAEACRRVDATEGRLLILSAATGELEVVADRPPAHGARPRDDKIDLACADERPPDITVDQRSDGVLVRAPVFQNGVVVGLLETVAPAVGSEQLALLTTIAGLLPLVRSNLMFSAGLQLVPPIPDMSGDEASFRQRVHQYLASHTHAALACVYFVDEDLDVSLVFGPSAASSQPTFLTNPATLEQLREVALDHDRCVTYEVPVDAGEHDPTISSYLVVACAAAGELATSEAKVVESYAMLVGFPMKYVPCEAEVAVIRQLLALAAYLDRVYAYLHQVADRVGTVAEIGSAITGLEVSQKARHDAKNQIELAQNLISLISRRPGDSRQHLEELSVALRRVAIDLDEMKQATRAPERERIECSLKDIWDTACSQVRFRMSSRRIDLHYDGPDVAVVVAPDWFRQVFLNLLLNSADAFDSANRRKGRIVLRVQPSAERVQMAYSDDATGILPQHFLLCDVNSDMPLPERIFLPGVTSKEGGSGWGLYVCRSIIRAHRGSIELERSHSGTVFGITIPREDRP